MKHFAAFGQSNGGRQRGTVDMGPLAFRNEILPPFRAGVQEGQVSAVMPAYHAIDGVPCHGNRELLIDILREQWGFAGVTVADFGGVDQLNNLHHVVADDAQAARLGLLAGVDMDLPDGHSYSHLLAMLASDAALCARVDEAVLHVLTLKFRLGLFDNPYADRQQALQIVNCPEHHQLSITAGQRSAVLLQNRQELLPLAPAALRRIAVIGPHASLPHLGPDRRGMNTIYDGICRRLGPRVDVRWAQGCRLTSKDGEVKAYLEETGQVAFSELQGDRAQAEMARLLADERPQMLPLALETQLIAEAVAVARDCELAIVCLGESRHCVGEDYGAARGDRDSLEFVGNQLELLRAVKATGVKVIVLLVHTRALVLGEVVELADAILDLWDSGEARGEIAAGILFGDAEPGGRLPVTIPFTVGQLPCHYSQHAPDNQRGYAFRDAMHQFPFGFGLTYTNFQWGEPRLSADAIAIGDGVEVTVAVTNSGRRAGSEVVQAYVTDCVGSVSRPRPQLQGFARVHLQPGETREVTIHLGPEAFRFINHALQEVIEPGEFLIGIGPDADRVQAVRLYIREEEIY